MGDWALFTLCVFEESFACGSLRRVCSDYDKLHVADAYHRWMDILGPTPKSDETQRQTTAPGPCNPFLSNSNFPPARAPSRIHEGI
jgi:hypothetical protein